ncbi:MAG TPA: acetyl-CoA acetyltransferase [Candidatus Dormibacteraeota bacterium]
MGSRRPSFLGRTAIAGVGYTTLSRASGRSVLSLAAEACRNALDDAGLERERVGGIASFSVLADSVPGQSVATVLGLGPLGYVLDMSLGGQAPSFLVMNAAMAVESGLADAVLVYRALNGRSGVRVGSTQFPGPGSQYRYPIGFTAYPQYMAMWARRYMIETGAGCEDLAAVALAQRAYAELNERAIVRRPLTLDEYLAAPFVADPYRAPDCTSEVDGACALLVTSLDTARQLRHDPVVVQGAAYALGRRSGLDIGDALLWEDYSRNYTSLLADDLWRSAGLGPDQVDLAEIYDCFTSTVLFGLEGLGFVGRGEAGEFVRSGGTALEGRLPTNTNGGLLCEGYLHGMNTVAEAVLQVQGRAGPRQVARHDSCVVTSGGMMDGSALVLTRA